MLNPFIIAGLVLSAVGLLQDAADDDAKPKLIKATPEPKAEPKKEPKPKVKKPVADKPTDG